MLDDFRQRRAVNHEVLRQRLYPGDKLSQDYQLTINRQVGIPVAFLRPEQKSVASKGYKLQSTWNAKGNPAATQRMWKEIHGAEVKPGSLEVVLRWLEEQEYLTWQEIGGKDDKAHGLQVSVDLLEFESAQSFSHCSICNRIASNEPPGLPCRQLRVSGADEVVGRSDRREESERLLVVEKYAGAVRGGAFGCRAGRQA